MNLDKATAKMAVAVTVGEIDEEPDRHPDRQHDHCREGQIHEQEHAPGQRERADQPKRRGLEPASFRRSSVTASATMKKA